MSKLGQIRRRIFKFISMIIDVVGVLSGLLTILAFLGFSTAVLGYVGNIVPLTVIGLLIVFSSVLLGIFFYTLLEEKTKTEAALSPGSNVSLLSSTTGEETRRTKPIPTDTIEYPPPPPEEVIVLRKEIVYDYLPDGKTMFQRKYLQVQALQNGLTHFKDRFRWTGKGTCNLISLTPGFKITNLHKEEEEIWDYFDVSFPYPLHKGDIADFTVEWELIDEEKIAVQFLSTMIDRETRYLFLQVNLPPELAPRRAHFHQYANYIDTLPEHTQSIQWSPATKCLSYEVTQPKKYHKYLIRWYHH